MENDTDLQTVLDLERALQTRPLRCDAARLGDLLAPDFLEIGASAREWDRASILAMLADERADPTTPEIEVLDLWGRWLAVDLVQVFWDSRVGDRRARRTSLWRRDGSRWRQIYHQGTPLR